ncbi:MAG: UvrD-helicase domain-containing protein [Puniceicoccales bacterium]|jgi:superfamily I DNA/RNA helicase|nr:UvrD-helicase domain-containing protein [Puniceicoccales bacterium]
MSEILKDQWARDRFRGEIDRNFLIVAPAGVGKTTAISDRIACIAVEKGGIEKLNSLVVITYTRKAAAEIRGRVAEKLRREGLTMAQLNVAPFFGTIDSFFLHLLEKFGGHLQRRGEMHIIEPESPDERQLWHDFLEDSGKDWNHFLPETHLLPLMGLCSWEKLLRAARFATAEKDAVLRDSLPPLPEINWELILHSETHSKKILEQREMILDWRKNFYGGYGSPMEFHGEWSREKVNGRPFCEICNDYWLRPLAEWVEVVGGIFCHRMAEAYRSYRISRSFAFYGDIGHCVRQMVCDESILRRLRGCAHRILLDEAQDTSVDDFSFLLKIVPQDSEEEPCPSQGHFSLVGDAQQSIYAENGEKFRRFLDLCEQLKANLSVEELVFHVTMRCPADVVGLVNGLFPRVLDHSLGQARFIPMEVHPAARRGAVLRIDLNGTFSTPAEEVVELGNFFSSKTPEDFAIDSWSQLAILGGVNRKNLLALEGALRANGIPATCKIRQRIWGDFCIFRWLCGLIRIFVFPTDFRELASVLREIFGLSDGKVADHVARFASPREAFSAFFQDDPSKCLEGEPEINAALNALRMAWEWVRCKHIIQGVEYLNERFQLLEKLRFCLDAAAYGQELFVWKETLSWLCGKNGHEIFWEDFWKNLQRQFFSKCDIFMPNVDGIYIDTLHGSKGLEWPVVLLPFAQFPITSRNFTISTFSYLDNQPIWPVLGGTERHLRLKNAYDGGKLQAFGRLLYVALTRTKGTLLFTGTGECDGKKFHIHAPRAILSMATEKIDPYSAEKLTPITTSCGRAIAFSNEREPAEVKCDEICGRTAVALERLRGQSIIAANEREKIQESAAISYGNWWHGCMRYFPWSGSSREQADYLQLRMDGGPNGERGRREMELFLHSSLPSLLREKFCRFYAEWPFYNRDRASGIIDLLCISEDGNRICIIDWKTDGEAAEWIGDCYRQQLRRYVEFFHGSGDNGREITAAVYFTVLGKLIFADDQWMNDGPPLKK